MIQHLHNLIIKIRVQIDFNKNPKYSNHKIGQLTIESLCWKLHGIGDDLGSLMLADYLRLWGYSWINKNIDINKFYKEQYDHKFERLMLKNNKDALEYYFAGHHYATGVRISKSLKMARMHFNRSVIYGHPAGNHENLIAKLIDDDFNSKYFQASGIAKKDSLAALSICASIKCIQSCEMLDIGMVKNLFNNWNKSIYSDYGKRFFNIEIEQSLKIYSNKIININNNSSLFIFGLISAKSRSNPTGKKSIEWYKEGALRGHIPCAVEWVKSSHDKIILDDIVAQLLEVFGILPLDIVENINNISSNYDDNDYD